MSQTPPSAASTGPSRLSGLCAIALPIGNSGDLSPRARVCLESADLIAAEDTRVFQQLVSLTSVKLRNSVKIFSHHNHNERESTPELVRLMKAGASLALVSDAGTPNISDPGHHLLEACFENQIPVTAVPGPSSLTFLLSVCPIGGTSFSFHGFFPAQTGDAVKLLQKLKGVVSRAVFFASPHRILQDLELIGQTYGDIPIFIGRELTKQYEEFLYLKMTEAIAHLQVHAPRGEFTFVIEIPDVAEATLSRDELAKQILSKLKEGMTARDLRNHFTGQSELSRQDLYDLIEEMKNQI